MNYAAALVDQNRLFGELTFETDPATPIPTCPGWSILQLFRHVGRGDRWAAEIIRRRATTDLDPRTVPDGRPPDDPDRALAWLYAGTDLLLEAVDTVPPGETVSTFSGPRLPQWWVRRRLHEATIHRADAALALGRTYELDPDLAADGIEEWLDRLAESGLPDQPLKDDAVLLLEATDLEGRWAIKGVANGIVWSHVLPEGTKPDVQLTARASDVLLALVRRTDSRSPKFRFEGDPDIWTTWLARTPL